MIAPARRTGIKRKPSPIARARHLVADAMLTDYPGRRSRPTPPWKVHLFLLWAVVVALVCLVHQFWRLW